MATAVYPLTDLLFVYASGGCWLTAVSRIGGPALAADMRPLSDLRVPIDYTASPDRPATSNRYNELIQEVDSGPMMATTTGISSDQLIGSLVV